MKSNSRDDELEADWKQISFCSRSDMSAGSNQRSEDQFLCSICLDVFTDPVSTPCGHNFCSHCITQHWDANVVFKCPMCKENFPTRPQLKVNTFIREMVSQFKHEAQQNEELSGLQDRMCRKHSKPLELFCETDQTCVCVFCSVLDHKTHDLVPLREEYEGKKAELVRKEAGIQKRRLKIEELKETVKISKDAADRETAEAVQVFTALIEAAHRGLDEVIEEIQAKQKATEKQAEDLIKDLEQEITKLMERSSGRKQPSRSQSVKAASRGARASSGGFYSSFRGEKGPAVATKNLSNIRVHPPLYKRIVVSAVSQLEQTIRKEKEKLVKAELNNVQQFAVDVTLDPDTANSELVLSDDGKEVHHSDVKTKLPHRRKRFSYYAFVLGSQSFSSGRFYFEVQVKDKTDWTLGVVSDLVSRKGENPLSPEEGFWTMCLINGNDYCAQSDAPVPLHLPSALEKVGVFVDYEETLVSFYDVDAEALIFSFTGCCFTEKLYPLFGPCTNDGGKNSAPLIICPVNQTRVEEATSN